MIKPVSVAHGYAMDLGLPLAETPKGDYPAIQFIKAPSVSVVFAEIFNPECPPKDDKRNGTVFIEGSRYGVMLSIDDRESLDEIQGQQCVLISPEIARQLSQSIDVMLRACEKMHKKACDKFPDEYIDKFCPGCGEKRRGTKVQGAVPIDTVTFYCDTCCKQQTVSSRN